MFVHSAKDCWKLIAGCRYRLSADMKKLGSDPTDRQSLDCFNRRSSLSSRIIKHRQQAAFFIDIRVLNDKGVDSLAEETDGRPELAKLYLPSRLGVALSPTDRSLKAQQLEYKLRRTTCLRAVHRIRLATIQKKQVTRGKQRNAKGEIMRTRAQTTIDRISEKVDVGVWEYQNSYKAMEKLKFQENDSTILRPILKADLDALWKFLDMDRAAGEGYKKAPWLWLLTGSDSTSGAESDREVQKEIDEGEIIFGCSGGGTTA